MEKAQIAAAKARRLLHASYCIPPATCYLLPATCYLPPATCYLLPATCYLLPATCYLLPTAYRLTLTTDLLPAKARAASDAKGKFLASMSHEMRTPLNGVLGMLQLAMELELLPRALQYCQNAMMSAQHLMNLVNDILDISKIEAGKLELEQRVFHLPDVLRAAVEIVQVDAVHKHPPTAPLTAPLTTLLTAPLTR